MNEPEPASGEEHGRLDDDMPTTEADKIRDTVEDISKPH